MYVVMTKYEETSFPLSSAKLAQQEDDRKKQLGVHDYYFDEQGKCNLNDSDIELKINHRTYKNGSVLEFFNSIILASTFFDNRDSNTLKIFAFHQGQLPKKESHVLGAGDRWAGKLRQENSQKRPESWQPYRPSFLNRFHHGYAAYKYQIYIYIHEHFLLCGRWLDGQIDGWID